MNPTIVISAPATSRSGYGDHTRELIRALIKLDKYEVSILDQKWGACDRNALTTNDIDISSRILKTGLQSQPDVWIQVTVPNEFQPVGKFNIGITAGIETDICAPQWIEGCNRMNLIITTSEHSKESFVKSVFEAVDNNTKQRMGEVKLQKPIEVLFEGLDTNVFKKTNDLSVTITDNLDKIKEDFCYLVVGHWLSGDFTHDRKDIGGTISTLIQTFKNVDKRNRPALVIKTSGATFSVSDRETILKKLKSITSNYNKDELLSIYLIHGDLSPDEMNSLYNHSKIKAMVSFTHGEGFGRPMLEFSVTQKPVIVSKWSGHLDFLKHAVLLPGELKQVHQSATWENVILPESKWYYVNYPYASKILKDVYDNYKKYIPDARKQAMVSREEFNHDKMTVLLGEILDKYVPKQIELKLPKLQNITLPKLKKVESND
jgi:hypothetical protein